MDSNSCLEPLDLFTSGKSATFRSRDFSRPAMHFNVNSKRQMTVVTVASYRSLRYHQTIFTLHTSTVTPTKLFSSFSNTPVPELKFHAHRIIITLSVLCPDTLESQVNTKNSFNYQNIKSTIKADISILRHLPSSDRYSHKQVISFLNDGEYLEPVVVILDSLQ